jgi:hypothetical protein
MPIGVKVELKYEIKRNVPGSEAEGSMSNSLVSRLSGAGFLPLVPIAIRVVATEKTNQAVS